MAKKTKLRKLAEGQACQVRFPLHCNRNPETTVLCHIRRGGVAGMGQKPNDLCSVIACSACHDVIDGRTPFTIQDKDSYILEGMCRSSVIYAKALNIG